MKKAKENVLNVYKLYDALARIFEARGVTLKIKIERKYDERTRVNG